MNETRSAPSYKSYLKYLFLFIIVLYCSGCVTTNLKIDLEITSDSSNEIGRIRNKALVSKYCGQEIINDKQFHRYMISGTRTSCKYNSNIDMLLPIEVGKDSKVLFRESNLNNTCINQQTAQIYYYSSSPYNFNLEPLLMNNPNQIFIVRTHKPGSEMKVHYKYTSEDQVERFAALNADSSDLKWYCRDKGDYITNCILLPFAVVVDVITLPLQVLFLYSLK